MVVSAQVQATTTSLSLSAVSSVPAGTLETMTVQVFDSHNTLVPRGMVVFYDGLRVLGQSSIREAGAGPIGSAVFKTRLGFGSHMLSAKYLGLSAAYVASQSNSQSLMVTGLMPVSLGLTSTGAGLYNLTATAQSQGLPSGQVSFVDQTNGNAVLGSANLTSGTSRISFKQVATFSTAAATTALTDVNGDGFLDIVTSPQTLFGKGDGTFTASGVPVGTYSGTVADFNRDGFPDFLNIDTPLTSLGYNQAVASVYLGNGAGSFSLTATATQPSFTSRTSSIIGDLNNDGIPDIVGFLPSNQPVFFGQANGTIAYATNASLNSLNGKYSFYTSNAFFRDLNGDGNLDAITPYPGYQTISIAFTDGKGSSGPVTSIPTGLVSLYTLTVDDVNGDGKLDLISVGLGGGIIDGGAVVSVCLGDGAGHFGTPLISSAAGYSAFGSPVQTGDVNGDGIPDVMVASQPTNGQTPHYYIFPGKGDGTFGAPVDTGINAQTVAGALETLADVDGDGLADIVANGTVALSTSGSTATATLSGVTLNGMGNHSVVAVYGGTSSLAPAKSAALSLAGTGTGSGGGVDASTGFSTAQGFHLNGTTQINGTALQLTDGGLDEASSAWSPSPVRATSFTTDFHFKITNPQAEGFTFAIQNSSPTAIGSAGGELGFNPIANGVALKFDIFDNAGEGANTVGLYSSGSTLTGPGMALPSNVSLLAGHTMLAHVTYDGFTLNLLLTDTSTGATATYRKVMDIPGTIGSNTAYVGFTASTGTQTSTIQIIDWTYSPGTLSMDSVAGFTNLGLRPNGTAYIQGTDLNLTQNSSGVPTAQFRSASVWSTSPFDITSFHSRFTFVNEYTIYGPPADGFTFTLQRSGPTAIGSFGGELGFNYIPNSVALKFDFFDNDGEGANTTGLYPAGVSLTDASLSVPITGFDIRQADYTQADVTYDGTTLTLVLTDGYTAKTFTWSKVVNLPALIGGNTAFVGFTAGTGQLTTAIFIESWRHVTGSTQ